MRNTVQILPAGLIVDNIKTLLAKTSQNERTKRTKYIRCRHRPMKPWLSSLGLVDMQVDAQRQIRLLQALSSATQCRGRQ